MMISEFNITYVSQKAIKGQVITNFLVDGPADEPSSLRFDFPDEHILCVEVESRKIVRWNMCFDGVVNQLGLRDWSCAHFSHMYPYPNRRKAILSVHQQYSRV